MSNHEAQVGCPGLGLHGRAIDPKLHFLIREQTIKPEIPLRVRLRGGVGILGLGDMHGVGDFVSEGRG